MKRKEEFVFGKEISQRTETKLFAEYLLPWAESLPGNLILDAAGGTGVESALLSEHGYRICLTDISHSMIHESSLSNKGVADLEALPFSGITYDGVILKDVWIFLDPEQRIAVLHELKRILKKSGSIFLMSQSGDAERIHYIPHGSQYPQKETCDNYEDCAKVYEKLLMAGDNIFSVEHISTVENAMKFAKLTGFRLAVLGQYSFNDPLAQENRWVQRSGFIVKLTKK